MSEQQEQDFSQIIDAGLADIQSGKMTLEEVLDQHPEQAELIRPELEAAMWLVSMQHTVAPRAGYINASRRRMVERIQQETSSRGTRRALFGFLWPPRFAYRTVAALVIVVLLLIASGGVVSAAQGSVPGDGLYSVKRFSETVAYQATADPGRRAELSIEFSGRRLVEAQTLITRGDSDRANIALAEYEQSVHQAMAELDRIPDSQMGKVGAAAVVLKNKLSGNDDLLHRLRVNAPAAAVNHLDKAMEQTDSSLFSVNEVYNEANGITPTPTSTPTETPTTLPSSTATPSPTPTVPLNSTTTLTPESLETMGAESAKPSPTPTKPGKVIKTPKPTNDNRPPKPEGPPGQDKDPGGNPPNDNQSKK